MEIRTASIVVPKLPPAAADAFRTVPTSVISDSLDRMAGSVGLQQFHRSGRMVGRALTVLTRPGDNLAIHHALELAEPGDVIVVDGGGDTTRALVGEIMSSIAAQRGVAGFVIDGAIRDVGVIRASDFPCFARGVNHRGPYKTGPGSINVPVSIGGWIISPGDVVVGDEDGVVSFSPTIAESLIGVVRAQISHEEETLKAIRNGRYDGSYGTPRIV